MTNEELVDSIQNGIDVQNNTYLLYTQNLPLLRQWSRPYYKALGEEDALQECYFALYKAIKGFDLSMSIKFTTYLQKCVTTHLANHNGLKISRQDYILLAKYNKLVDGLQQDNSTIALTDIAKQLDCNECDIERILNFINITNPESLDKPMLNDEDNDNIVEQIADDIDIIDMYEKTDTKSHLKGIWQCVNDICYPNEAEVIKAKWLDNTTYTEIANNNGYSISNAKQIEQRGFKRLKNNEDFIYWVASVYDIPYHYGFNAWKNNGASAVEIAFDVKERYRLWKESQVDRERAIIKKKMLDWKPAAQL